MPRSLFLVASAFLGLLTAQGSTIKDFTIVNATNPGIRGGVFNGGGTYYGDFSVDTSLIPTDGSATEVPLASFDVFIALPGQSVIEIASSGSFGSGGGLNLSAAFTEGGLQLQFDELEFVNFSPPESLELDLVERVGTFKGGLVLHALAEQFTLPPVAFSDSSESALVVDPAALVPEPSSMALIGVGAAVFAALRRRGLRGAS